MRRSHLSLSLVLIAVLSQGCAAPAEETTGSTAGNLAVAPIQTYAVIRPTPIWESPNPGAPIAQHGTANLPLGARFSGRPDANGTVWVASGVGFVPASAVALAFTYQAQRQIFVQEDHRPDAPVALGGTAFLSAFERVDAAQIEPGWLWLVNGLGFVPTNGMKIVAVAPVTYPGEAPPPPPPPPVLAMYVVEGGDTLSTISEKFYGTQGRALDIYEANRDVIGPDPAFILPGMKLVIPV